MICEGTVFRGKVERLKKYGGGGVAVGVVVGHSLKKRVDYSLFGVGALQEED